MNDVRIHKPEIIRRSFCGLGNSFVHGPNFSSPAGRKLTCTMNGYSFICVTSVSSSSGKIASAIAAVIVHHDRGELAGIVLVRQRSDGPADGLSLVARRNNCHDARPSFQRRGLNGFFVELPEVSSCEKEIQPNGERKDCYESRRQSHELLCNKFL